MTNAIGATTAEGASTRNRKVDYLRVASEEAFAPAELLDRWRKLLQGGGKLDPDLNLSGASFWKQSPCCGPDVPNSGYRPAKNPGYG